MSHELWADGYSNVCAYEGKVHGGGMVLLVYGLAGRERGSYLVNYIPTFLLSPASTTVWNIVNMPLILQILLEEVIRVASVKLVQVQSIHSSIHSSSKLGNILINMLICLTYSEWNIGRSGGRKSTCVS